MAAVSESTFIDAYSNKQSFYIFFVYLCLLLKMEITYSLLSLLLLWLIKTHRRSLKENGHFLWQARLRFSHWYHCWNSLIRSHALARESIVLRWATPGCQWQGGQVALKWTRNLLCVCASWWIARNSAPTEENMERKSYSAGKRLSVGTINYRGASTHCFLLAKPPFPEKKVFINRRAVIIERRAVRLTYRGDLPVWQCPKIFACESLLVRVCVCPLYSRGINYPSIAIWTSHQCTNRFDRFCFLLTTGRQDGPIGSIAATSALYGLEMWHFDWWMNSRAPLCCSLSPLSCA